MPPQRQIRHGASTRRGGIAPGPGARRGRSSSIARFPRRGDRSSVGSGRIAPSPSPSPGSSSEHHSSASRGSPVDRDRCDRQCDRRHRRHERDGTAPRLAIGGGTAARLTTPSRRPGPATPPDERRRRGPDRGTHRHRPVRSAGPDLGDRTRVEAIDLGDGADRRRPADRRRGTVHRGRHAGQADRRRHDRPRRQRPGQDLHGQGRRHARRRSPPSSTSR